MSGVGWLLPPSEDRRGDLARGLGRGDLLVELRDPIVDLGPLFDRRRLVPVHALVIGAVVLEQHLGLAQVRGVAADFVGPAVRLGDVVDQRVTDRAILVAGRQDREGLLPQGERVFIVGGLELNLAVFVELFGLGERRIFGRFGAWSPRERRVGADPG